MRNEKSRTQRLDRVIRERRSGSALKQKEFGKVFAKLQRQEGVK